MTHYLTPLPIFGLASYLSPRFVRAGHNLDHNAPCKACK